MRRLLLLLGAVFSCSAQEYIGVSGYGPHISQQPLDKIYDVDSGLGSLFLNCEAEGDERPSYIWKKDGVEVNDNRYQLSGGRLTITDPDRDVDAGVYQCFPSNQIGTIMSDKAKLDFAFVGSFPDQSPPDRTINLNTGTCITCDSPQPPQSNPDLIVSWYKGSIPVSLSGQSRTHTTADGRLCFANFVPQDVGSYNCFVKNTFVTDGGSALVKFSDSFTLSAGPSDPVTEHGPEAAYPVADVEAVINQAETILNCFFFGNPVPSLDWRRKTPVGEELPVGYEMRSYDQQLVLKNIQVDDAGEYECYTSQGNGQSAGIVVVRVPPTLVQALEDTNGNIYESVIFNCEAESSDGVAYTWYRNAEVITTLPRHQFSNGLMTLTITNLTVEDTGMYQCVASNEYGEVNTAAQLIVLAIIPWFRTPVATNQPAPRGGSVTILCQPEAAPTPAIQWTKGLVPIASDDHYTVMDNGSLVISDVTDADGGEYTCTATNSQGTGASTGSLIIKDGTSIIEGPSDITINEGDTGSLTCRATHDPYFELRYVWMKDGTQIDLRKANYEQPEIVSGQPSVLIILEATIELGGVYTCMAITTIDEKSAMATLTIQGRPGAPAGISAEVNGLTANVTWSHGADNNSPILSYIVEGSTNHVPEWTVLKDDILSTSTRSRLTGLSAWSTYKFRVLAVNAIGQGEPSEESEEQQTAQDRPTQVPTRLGGGGGNDGDLRITWTPLPSNEWNAPDLVYIIFWKSAGTSSFQQDTVTNPAASVFVTSGVPAYIPFDVEIQVQNAKGPGPRTDTFTVFSYQKRPEEAPSSVTAIPLSSTSIEVSWVGIDVDAIVGELKGYKLKYWPADSTEENGEIVRSGSAAVKATIQELMAATQYNIRVMAYSGGGNGPSSEEVATVTTLRPAPQQAPANVKAVLKSKGTAVITWDAVTTGEGEEPLMGYKVSYWPRANLPEDAITKEVDKTATTITLNGLQMKTTYLIVVKAHSAGGDGATSERISLSTVEAKTEPFSGAPSAVTQSLFAVLLPLLIAFHLR